MTLDEAMAKLEALGSEKMRQFNAKNGVDQAQFGVKMGDLRALAKTIKSDHALAQALWSTSNLDAMLLATLLLKPKLMSVEEVDMMVGEATFPQLADWLNTHVVKLHPQKEEMRRKWMESDDTMRARAGWSLTTERVVKNPAGLDLAALLTRIENEMGAAPEKVQWTMNFCLGEIGITSPEHRERAVAIGEKLGVFRDYPTSKGCTSPFVPIWVAEMVRRQG